MAHVSRKLINVFLDIFQTCFLPDFADNIALRLNYNSSKVELFKVRYYRYVYFYFFSPFFPARARGKNIVQNTYNILINNTLNDTIKTKKNTKKKYKLLPFLKKYTKFFQKKHLYLFLPESFPSFDKRRPGEDLRERPREYIGRPREDMGQTPGKTYNSETMFPFLSFSS